MFAMATVINFNKARKQRAREQAALEAAANRVRHGRSKVERALDAKIVETAALQLDQRQRAPLDADATIGTPDEAAVYGWVTLDRRGDWQLRGTPVTRPTLIDHFNHHYRSDPQGRWFIQHGWQQVFVDLETLPIIARTDADTAWVTHTGRPLGRVLHAYLDEEGSLMLMTADGPAGVAAEALGAALDRLHHVDGHAMSEADLATALAEPDGRRTALVLEMPCGHHRLQRLDRRRAAEVLDFRRQPRRPLPT